MNRTFPLYLLAIMAIGSIIASCNSNNNEEPEIDPNSIVWPADMGVTAFSLKADDSILNNLDSVHFSIDLKQRLIYNADSLPRGTKTSGMVIQATLAANAQAKVVQRGGTVRRDTTYTYTGTDTVDFTGDVFLRVFALNGDSLDYKVTVNVHQLEPDSLYWNQLARRALPGAAGTVQAQKTVKCGDKAYTLLHTSAGYTLHATDNPADDSWSAIDMQLAFTPQVNTLTATDNELYILDDNGALYSSADGKQWSNCGIVWHNITGGYTDRALGIIRNSDGSYSHDEYPRPAGYAPQPVSQQFPVSDNSDMTLYTNPWAISAQGLIVCGRNAQGQLLGNSWGYDGKQWGLLGENVLPKLQAPAITQYTTFTYNKATRTATEHRSWLVIGGQDADGNVTSTVYISRQQGLLWSKADQQLQLPDYIAPFTRAQALTFTSTLSTRSHSTSWHATPSQPLPVWAKVYQGEPFTRTATAITEWDCPYIYLFGGEDSQGTVSNTIWRGVINRLTFKPLY